jgi:predicted dehydrogenase
LEAVRRGCHLFVEKPLSHTLDGINELLAVSRKRNLTTMVACNMRFHPGPAAVKRVLDEQAIGNIIAARIQTASYLPHWRPSQDYRKSYSASVEYGGAILDCIHEIDLALWYLGSAKVLAAVSLSAKSIGLKTDGLAEIILRHKSGALCNVHLNFVQRDYRRTCQIIGSEGTIYWNFTDHAVRVFDADGKLARTIAEPQGWEINQMYIDELSHFISAVRGNSQTMNPLSVGLDALKIALVARKLGNRKWQ